MGETRQGRDFINLIDGAAFAGLGEGQHGRQYLVRAKSEVPLERGRDGSRLQLPGLSLDAYEPQPAAEKFRRAAFVRNGMGFAMAQHGPPRRRQMRQRQCIGGSAGAHQKYRHVTFKHFREPTLQPSGQGVVPVRNGASGVGANQSVQNRGRHSGGVIAGKFHVQSFQVGARPSTAVTRGLDPRVHLLRIDFAKMMDARVARA